MKIFLIFVITVIALSFPAYVFAVCNGDPAQCQGLGEAECKAKPGVCVWKSITTGEISGAVKLNNPLGPRNPNVNTMIGNVINGVLGIVGSLALAMFIYGGFVWMTASGSKERIEKGKNILVWATLGLVVIFSAYTIVYFVLSDVLGGG